MDGLFFLGSGVGSQESAKSFVARAPSPAAFDFARETTAGHPHGWPVFLGSGVGSQESAKSFVARAPSPEAFDFARETTANDFAFAGAPHLPAWTKPSTHHVLGSRANVGRFSASSAVLGVAYSRLQAPAVECSHGGMPSVRADYRSLAVGSAALRATAATIAVRAATAIGPTEHHLHPGPAFGTAASTYRRTEKGRHAKAFGRAPTAC